MAVNKYNFRWMYLQDFRTAVDYFAKILSEKVILDSRDFQKRLMH